MPWHALRAGACSRSHGRRHVAGFGRAILALLLLVVGLCAAAQAKPPSGPTNSRAAREDATRLIPFDKLDPAVAAQVKSVVLNPTVFRRMPTQVFDCDPKMYVFMLRNPEVIVNIWQLMGITKVELTRSAPNTYLADDGAGARGKMQTLFTNHDTHVVYVDGVYDGPLFPKPIRGKCVLLIKSAYVQETNRRYYVTSRCDAFISMENVGMNLLAKTFQPLVNKSADLNFMETTAFVSNVSHTAEQKPAGMARLAGRMNGVSPEVREQFVTLTEAVARRSRENRQLVQADPARQQLRGQNVSTRP
jgi:hypothetical protein